ncbi:MAG: HAMP domain-containing sensor histidine kinase [Candidatus Limivivens sp.]|nr:HAMP domain-containing sensor histidine kinase [Candidatus Limivivens sp.]
MRRLLLPKFLLIFCCYFILGFITFSVAANSLLRAHLIRETSEGMYREANQIAVGRLAQSVGDETNLTDVYANLSALAACQKITVRLINNQGEIVLDTSIPYSPNTAIRLKDFNPGDWAGNYYQEDNFYGSFSEDVLTVVAPITSGLKTRGYVVLHYALSRLDSQRYSLMNICYILLLILLLLSLIILAAFFILVYRPLGQVLTAADEYAKGNLNYTFPVETDDEMGYLGASLQYMAGEINKSGEYQRKFISNISHDFRSPLTSIKGYVEAILDGTIPPEMQERYLKIVVSETERLNKLTSGLLTLNNFDDKKVLLDLSDFDINQVVRDTAAAFEVLCADKGIRIQLTFDNKSLLVSADMIKIQQVLYNLMDNAIKFSFPNSTIYLETSEHHEKVLISVKDTGEGIPPEIIDKIWDRFYKRDSSRGRDKKGTGLGLSITREIIQAHGEHINVVSTDGTGTEFTFSLRKAK